MGGEMKERRGEERGERRGEERGEERRGQQRMMRRTRGWIDHEDEAAYWTRARLHAQHHFRINTINENHDFSGSCETLSTSARKRDMS